MLYQAAAHVNILDGHVMLKGAAAMKARKVQLV